MLVDKGKIKKESVEAFEGQRKEPGFTLRGGKEASEGREVG